MPQSSKRKRAPIVGWIPAIILSVAIIAVGVSAVLLVGSGLGGPVPKPTAGQVTDLNWSIFTPDGMAFIDRTREVRFDMSKAPIEAASLGLEDDATLVLKPIDNGDTSLDYDLIVNGGGEGPGGGRFVATQVTIVTENGFLTHVIAPIREVLNFRQTLDSLTATAEVWGWDVSGTDAIFQTAEDATRSGQPYEFTFGPADRSGVPVSATARCDTSGYCVVEYDVAPPVG